MLLRGFFIVLVFVGRGSFVLWFRVEVVFRVFGYFYFGRMGGLEGESWYFLK